MTPEEYNNLLAAYNLATPAPWMADVSGPHRGTIKVEENGRYIETVAEVYCGAVDGHGANNAKWLVAMHNSFPKLVRYIRDLEAQLGGGMSTIPATDEVHAILSYMGPYLALCSLPDEDLESDGAEYFRDVCELWWCRMTEDSRRRVGQIGGQVIDAFTERDVGLALVEFFGELRLLTAVDKLGAENTELKAKLAAMIAAAPIEDDRPLWFGR